MTEKTKSTKYFKHGYALLIGVGADLPVTIKDAQAVYDIFIDKARCGYKKENIKLLTGEVATRTNILSGLDWLSTNTNKDNDAVVIIYFSGHGGMIPSYHLVPYGYNSKLLGSTSISGVEFTNKLKAIKAKKVLILFNSAI